MFAFVVDWEESRRAGATAAKLWSSRRPAPPVVLPAAREMAAAAVESAPRGLYVARPSGDLLVALDGHIDDALVIRRELGLVEAAPMAEVVASAYLRWGPELIAHLRGDFALVIWDGARGLLLAARDPFGVVPLQYARWKGLLCIASDADQFLAAGAALPVPDAQSVVEFLTRDYQTLDRSFFRDVAKLPPGHLLTATRGRISLADYRRPPSSELSFRTTADCHEAFRATFFTAVKRRLSRARPVLIQLSGGVDSTSIACVADAVLGAAPAGVGAALAASATFPGLDCDETRYIDAVAADLTIPVIRWDGTKVNGVEFAEPLPAAPGGRIPWSGGTEGFVEIARSHHAGTVLDGSGGDQLGMPMALEVDELLRGDWSALARDLFPSGFSLGQLGTVLRWAVKVSTPEWARRFKRDLLPRHRPDWLIAAAGHPPGHHRRPVHRFSSRGQRLRWQALTGAALATSIEMKQRHASLFGLEMTFPFLDWDLVQFTLAVPPQHWPAPRWLARLHREALRSDLPNVVYARQSKADFTSAMANRVRCNLRPISSMFEVGSWACAEFVDRPAATRLLARFQRDPAPDFGTCHALWAIASVEAWLRLVLRYRTPEGTT